MGSYHRILLTVWAHEPTLPDLQRTYQEVMNLNHAHPSGFTSLVVLRDFFPPSEEVRVLTAKTLRDATAMRALGIVYSQAGFGAAALRAVVSGLLLLARARCPGRVFQSGDDAAKWLVSLLSGGGAPMTAEGLVRALSSLNDALDAADRSR
jgi:hypothetical protein